MGTSNCANFFVAKPPAQQASSLLSGITYWSTLHHNHVRPNHTVADRLLGQFSWRRWNMDLTSSQIRSIRETTEFLSSCKSLSINEIRYLLRRATTYEEARRMFLVNFIRNHRSSQMLRSILFHRSLWGSLPRGNERGWRVTFLIWS